MGSISNNPEGISFLTQPGTGLLSDLPVQLPASTLQSAPRQDVVDLSASAVQVQEVDGLFGVKPPPAIVQPVPAASNAETVANSPEQQAAASQQAVIQGLLYPNVNLLA
jgi:hypothetical protein